MPRGSPKQIQNPNVRYCLEFSASDLGFKYWLLSLFFRVLLLSYLLLRPRLRRKIADNFARLAKRKDGSFERRLAKRLAENASQMLLGIDKERISGDNIYMGKGVIFLTLHFGIWELLPLIFRSRGYPVAIAVSRQRNRFLDRILRGVRKRQGVRIVYSIPEMIRALREGYLLGFAVDSPRRTKRLYLEEDGFSILKTPFLLAKRTNSPLYAIFSYRTNQGVEIALAKIDMDELPLRAAERNFAQIAKEFIKNYPEEWIFWGNESQRRTKK